MLACQAGAINTEISPGLISDAFAWSQYELTDHISLKNESHPFFQFFDDIKLKIALQILLLMTSSIWPSKSAWHYTRSKFKTG